MRIVWKALAAACVLLVLVGLWKNQTQDVEKAHRVETRVSRSFQSKMWQTADPGSISALKKSTGPATLAKPSQPKVSAATGPTKAEPPSHIIYFDADFERGSSSAEAVKIPHIIHQTWKTYDVPEQFQNLSKSWSRVHPTWEYWYWTDADADKFIKKRYPKYYGLFRSYRRPILRADAMRYFILYEFGGVYADLDFEAVKDIDVFTRDHYGFLALEPTVHAQAVFGWDYLACNALMGAAPRHPFFKYVIQHLAGYNRGNYVLWQTGPAMLTDALRKYKKEKDSCACSVYRNETVYLADWKLFMPTLAGDNSAGIKKKCLKPPSEKWVTICDELKQNNFYDGSSIPSFSYTVHRWAHSHHTDFQQKNPVSIFQLINNAKKVGDIIDRLPQA